MGHRTARPRTPQRTSRQIESNVPRRLQTRRLFSTMLQGIGEIIEIALIVCTMCPV